MSDTLTLTINQLLSAKSLINITIRPLDFTYDEIKIIKLKMIDQYKQEFPKTKSFVDLVMQLIKEMNNAKHTLKINTKREYDVTTSSYANVINLARKRLVELAQENGFNLAEEETPKKNETEEQKEQKEFRENLKVHLTSIFNEKLYNWSTNLFGIHDNAQEALQGILQGKPVPYQYKEYN